MLSTLHTLNAAETINRIISTFPPHQEDQIRGQLAAVIQGIVSQRLVVRADGKGRVPAVEVMVAHRPHPRLHPRGRQDPADPERDRGGPAQYGMQTFDQSLLQLYREELVTYETARDAATNPDDFDLKVKGIFSTGEMTWEHPGGSNAASTAAPAQPARSRRRAGRGGAQPLREEGGRDALAAARRRRWTRRPRRLAAFDLLARKAWSGRELTRRLRRRGAPADVAQAVVADLVDRGYVDDQAFARWWAEARARGRRVGSHRLRQELLAKGIPRGLADAAIAAAFEEVAELERALEAGRRRPARPAARPGARAPARLADYLLRRGYPAATVRHAVRVLLAERGADLSGIEETAGPNRRPIPEV